MLTSMFCDIDDFCKHFEPIYQQHLLTSGQKRQRATRLTLSEMMTIVVFFHYSRLRDFKTYYNTVVCGGLRGHFPDLVSYNHFVELMPRTIMPLCVYLNQRKGACTGIAFMDSTALAVCHNRRIHQHRVFQGLAQRGKTSVDWFYGFKLHVVVNDQGELLAFHLSPGNVDDRKPVPALCRGLFGKLFADKGYISMPLTEQLAEEGVELITKLKKNMKPRLMTLFDKIMLRKRALIECVFDSLKNICQIEHSRHRSVTGFMVNLLAGLAAYTFLPKKPALQRVDTLPSIID